MGVAKAGLESTARYLARDLGPKQIRSTWWRPAAAHHRREVDRRFETFEQVWGERARWLGRRRHPPRRPACIALLSDWFPATTGPNQIPTRRVGWGRAVGMERGPLMDNGVFATFFFCLAFLSIFSFAFF